MLLIFVFERKKKKWYYVYYLVRSIEFFLGVKFVGSLRAKVVGSSL